MKSLSAYFKYIILLFLLFLTSPLRVFSQCYELVWSDEFNKDGLPDSSKWTFETGGNGWGNNELQYYTDSIENAEVRDGKLVITAREERFEDRNYTSARLYTYENELFWKYGKIEARMKLPYGKGIWPAFWMMGKNIEEVGWPACGEIDIMEMVGGTNGDNTIHGTVHWDNAGNHASYGQGKTLSEGIFADNFHTFSVEWNNESITWKMDGIQYNVIDITPAGLSEFHNEFFIILNLAVGGNWPGSPDTSTEFPQTLEVDYVRVYSSPEYLSVNGKEQVIKGSKGLEYSLPYSKEGTYLWSVSNDAVIDGTADSNQVKVNWGCEEGEISCTYDLGCGEKTITLPVSFKKPEIEGPYFFQDAGEDLVFNIPESGSTYEWIVPDDAVITAGNETNRIHVQWGATEGQVMVIHTNDCGSDTIARHVRKYGQYPYPNPDNPHILPGTVEATYYDYGGEGVAYHDTEEENQGPGPRSDEGVDTEYNDNGDPNVGWINSGEWLEYSIEVTNPGDYYTELRVSSNNAGSNGPLSIFINDELRLGPFDVVYTGGWNVFESIYPGEITLYETDTLLRYEFGEGGFNLGKFMVSTEDPNTRKEISSQDNVVIYPNPVRNYLYIQYPDQMCVVEIYKSNGMVVKRITTTRSRIDISDLDPGMYFIQIIDNKGYPHKKSFIIY